MENIILVEFVKKKKKNKKEDMLIMNMFWLVCWGFIVNPRVLQLWIVLLYYGEYNRVGISWHNNDEKHSKL